MSGQFSEKRDKPVAMPIDETKTEDKIENHMAVAYRRQRVFNNYLTTDNYEDSLIFDARLLKNKVIHVRNDHSANAVKVKILSCIDTSDWREFLAETVVNASSKLAEQTTILPFAFLKVQAKSSVGGNAGNVTAYIGGMTP